METKIDYSNLQNESKEKIMARYNELLADDGAVYAWSFNTDFPPSARTFSSEKNAKEYGVLNEERLRRWLGGGLSHIAYIIGTESDYQKAVKNWERDRAKFEAKRYAEHVAKMVDKNQQKIKALEALKDVCRTFDGKVINKRFNEAVKAATGLSCYFEDGYMSLDKYCSIDRFSEVHIFLHYRQGTGDFWQWTTGSRMEAEKAVSIIDIKINDYQEDSKRLLDTRKYYAKYVAKARKVEKLIEELCCEDIDLRQFAMRHDLKQYPSVTGIWKCS